MEQRKRTLAEVTSNLAAAKKELKAAQRKEQKAQMRRNTSWCLTAESRLGKTVLILYDLAGFDDCAAVDFLAAAAQRRHWDPKPAAELRILVSDLFLAVDADQYAGLCDVDRPLDGDAMRDALTYWEEWSLTAWVKDANVRKGVAPSTDVILQRLEERRLRLPEAVRPPARGSVGEARSRMWASRWRRKGGGRCGAIRARDDVSVQEMRDKAPCR